MLNQTLKIIYSFFRPAKKAGNAENKINGATPAANAHTDYKKSARLIYHRDIHIEHTPENTANAHDWWIN